jgi:hypothetical protein
LFGKRGAALQLPGNGSPGPVDACVATEVFGLVGMTDGEICASAIAGTIARAAVAARLSCFHFMLVSPIASLLP